MRALITAEEAVPNRSNVYGTFYQPEENLKEGDLAWLIDYVAHPGGGEEGAVLEVFNILGESIDVVTVPVSAVSVLQANFIPAVRVRA